MGIGTPNGKSAPSWSSCSGSAQRGDFPLGRARFEAEAEASGDGSKARTATAKNGAKVVFVAATIPCSELSKVEPALVPHASAMLCLFKV
jgi:hypothetical protein